ncbi:MAG: hypothetical protein QG623_333 [Patescibacteria group bacterium]|nr:hypothetical protein [Patescibacteria group bacterium]
MAGKIATKLSTKTKENTVGVIAAVIILLIALLVVAIGVKISSDRRARNLGLDGAKSSEVIASKLVDNAENSSVRIYVERGVIADEKHYSIEMTISANTRTIRVLRGYENIEEKSEGLSNNLEAYRAFLKALEKNDFTEIREDTSGYEFRAACPTERSYRFSLMEGSSETFDRWFTFCDGKRFGEYGGKVNATFSLFKNQFPNYGTITRGVSF